MLTVVAAVMCGNGWKFDLHDLAKHDYIEHDGSLVHADATFGGIYAPVDVDKNLLDDLLDTSKGDTLTFNDLVKYRLSRDQQLPSPLTKFHTVIARGEIAFTTQLFADKHGHIKKDIIRQWFGEERLPERWPGPSHTIGLIQLSKLTDQVASLTTQLAKKSD